jgi:hypothetical protein
MRMNKTVLKSDYTKIPLKLYGLKEVVEDCLWKIVVASLQ